MGRYDSLQIDKLISRGGRRGGGGGGGGGGGAAPPVAVPGAHSSQESLAQVTLDGSGSTGSPTGYTWTLRDPYGADRSSLLSSTTTASCTWTPRDIPGTWIATLIVSKAGLNSAAVSRFITIGTSGGYIRFVPTEASSSYDGGDVDVSYADTDGWLVATISEPDASVVYLKDTIIHWHLSDVSEGSKVQSIEFLIQFHHSGTFENPPVADQAFVGITSGNNTTPTSSTWQGWHTAFRAADGTPPGATRVSMRDAHGDAWGWTSLGGSNRDSIIGLTSYRAVNGNAQRQTINKVGLSTDPPTSHSAIITANITNSPASDDPIYVGLFAGRAATSTAGDVVVKFNLYYRVNRRIL